ncbi:MAG: hypothetical protein PVH77_02295 [Phycisphaerales bacterium]
MAPPKTVMTGTVISQSGASRYYFAKAKQDGRAWRKKFLTGLTELPSGNILPNLNFPSEVGWVGVRIFRAEI